MKKFLIVVFVFGAIVLSLGLAKDFLVRSLVVAAGKYVAGVDITIGHLSLGLIKQSVEIRDFKVYNPEGFPAKEVMVDIPEIKVAMDVPALLKNTLHVTYMRIHMKEAHVIKNRDKKLNVNSLKFAQGAESQGASTMSLPSRDQRKKEMKMQLDLVSLNIGKVVFEDYSSGKEKPRLTVLNINLKDQEFRNITSPAQLGSAVMVQALMPVGLDGAFSLGSKVIGGTAGKAIGVLGGAVTGLIGGIKKGLSE